jgi:hypothetical protein
MSADASQIQNTPVRVLLGRHLVGLTAVTSGVSVFAGSFSIWTLLGQLAVVLVAAGTLGGLVTLFSRERTLVALLSRCVIAAWFVALLMALPTLVAAFSDQSHLRRQLTTRAPPTSYAPSSTLPSQSSASSTARPITIADLRRVLPEFRDLTDREIAKRVHPHLAPDMKFEEFAERLGVKD